MRRPSSWPHARRQRGGGHRISGENLRIAAQTYRQAVADGRPTRKAVQAALNEAMSSQTAARWIQVARERIDPETGKPFLGPALGKRAGEGKVD